MNPAQQRALQVWLAVGVLCAVAFLPLVNYLKIWEIQQQLDHCGKILEHATTARTNREAATTSAERSREQRRESQFLAQLGTCEGRYLKLCERVRWDWKHVCSEETQDQIFGEFPRANEVEGVMVLRDVQ
jgi:hypothetical protein